MKKLVLLAALILIAGFCFAQDDAAAEDKPERLDLEVTIGFPIHWTNSPTPHVGSNVDKTVTADTSIGLSLIFNFSKKFGFTVDTDFFFGGQLMGISSTDSGYNSLFGANLLLGPVIYLYNGSFLRIPLALGVHMYYWSSDFWLPMGGAAGAWYKTRDLQFGPGAYLGIQFHFNDSLYIFSRTNVAIDVARWHQEKGVNSDSEFEIAFSWIVKPAIGIGVKF